MIDKSADVISSLTANFTIALLALLVITFFHIGAALWIGDYLGHYYYGFFIVAGFYAIITTLVVIFKTPWIKKPTREIFIKKLLN
jgi:membrane protein implicated in regulation of membrane protease activity